MKSAHDMGDREMLPHSMRSLNSNPSHRSRTWKPKQIHEWLGWIEGSGRIIDSKRALH
jgi:hypothetical protein